MTMEKGEIKQYDFNNVIINKDMHYLLSLHQMTYCTVTAKNIETLPKINKITKLNETYQLKFDDNSTDCMLL